MASKNYIFKGQEGFSMAELLVVIVIIVILSTFTLIQLRSPNEKFARQSIAWQLKAVFERARFDSVKRRADSSTLQSKVIVSGTSFTLITDANSDGDTTDSSDSVTTPFSGQNITITSYVTGAITFPVTIFFNQRGEVTAIDADGKTVNPIFLVCNGVCTSATANASNSNIVLLSPTGTVNLLPGTSEVPNFDAPSITDIPGGNLINDLVSLISGGNPTPSPVTTPIPDPSVTPVPTQTATPDPNATPSPSATPNTGDGGTPAPTVTPSQTPTATPTSTPHGKPTTNPTATPTATPASTPSCTISVPEIVTYSKDGSGSFTVYFANAASTVFTVTGDNSRRIKNISPTSTTSLASSGTFNVTWAYDNGNGDGAITISGCSSPRTVTINAN